MSDSLFLDVTKSMTTMILKIKKIKKERKKKPTYTKIKL